MAGLTRAIWLSCVSTFCTGLSLIDNRNRIFLPGVSLNPNIDIMDKFLDTPNATWNFIVASTIPTEATTGSGFQTFTKAKNSYVPLSNEEIKCRTNISKYAYDSGLCGETTISDYLNKSSALYTCMSRCGDTRTSSTDCACDEKCVKYNDCCNDIKLQCPEIYTKALNRTMGTYNTICVHGNSMAISHCMGFEEYYKGEYLDFIESLVSPPNSPQPPDLSTPVPAKDDSLTINIFADPHYFYTVSDSSTEILYYGIKSFQTCSGTEGVPLFTTRITTLLCDFNHDGSEYLPSAIDVLGHCHDASSNDVPPFKRRPCYSRKLLSCHCENGEIETDFLHNFCLGNDESVSDIHRFTPDRGVFQNREYVEKNKCILTPEDKSDLFSFANPPKLGQFIVNVSTTLVLSEDFVTTDNKKQEFNSASLNYIMDLTWTSETKLKCLRWSSPLLSCHLEACAEGAFIVTAPSLSKSFAGGRVCRYPREAVVSWQQGDLPLSTCMCLRILTAMSALKKWRITSRSGFRGKCRFRLDSYRFQKPSPEYQDKTYVRNTTTNFSDIKVYLEKQLNETSCPHQVGFPMVTICFHASFNEDPHLLEPLLCIRLFDGNEGLQRLQIKDENGAASLWTMAAALFQTMALALASGRGFV